ncbi:MAG: carbohydrate porin, partial [Rhodanobacteraceae bacterium]
LAAGVAGTAMAQQAPPYAETTLTGNWGGTRTDLFDKGVDFSAVFLGDGSYAAGGGTSQIGAFTNTTILGLNLDLGKMVGWQGASIHLQGTYRMGHSINDRAGIREFTEAQAQFGGGVDTGRANEAFFEQSAWGNKVDFKIGRMTFDSNGAGFVPVGCNTMGLNTCFNPVAWTSIIDFGNDVWPGSRYGASLQINPTSSWYMRVGAFKVTGNGVTHPGAIEMAALGWNSEVNGLPGTWEVGAWRDTAKFNTLDILGPDNPWIAVNPTQPVMKGSSGFYGVVNQQVTKNANNGGLSLEGFGVFDDQNTIALLDQLVGVGAIYKAPFASRPFDQIQLYVSRAHANTRFSDGQQLTLAQGLPAFAYGPIGEFYLTMTPQTSYEYVTELDYSAVVYRGLILMPNIQYIDNPGGNTGNHNATIIGLQLTAVF